MNLAGNWRDRVLFTVPCPKAYWNEPRQAAALCCYILSWSFSSGARFLNAKYTKSGSLSWNEDGTGGGFLGSTAVHRRGQFKIGNHEIHQMFPTLKVQIAGQGAQVIEEGFANPEFRAQQFVFGIYQI